MPGKISILESEILNPDPVALALAEDIGTGDLTCAYFVDAARSGKARIFAKQRCVLAGTDTAARAFALVDRSRRGDEADTLPVAENESARLLTSAATVDVRLVRKDGDDLEPGDTALEISGPVRSILTAERTAMKITPARRLRALG